MAATFQDYYKVLGVERTASPKEIKAAFRKLARKFHPDVNTGDHSAEERFKQISEANEVLSDPEKRRKYDEAGEHWKEYEAWDRAGRPQGGNPLGGHTEYSTATMSQEELEQLFGDSAPFSDFFRDLFGPPRRRPTSRAQRGGDLEGETDITLEEAYHGTIRTLELNHARGRRRVEVRIPAGVTHGARVRASGQGGAGAGGGASGDLYVRVRVLPHPRFTREGDMLRVRVAVPLDVALLGGTVEVPTLRGRPVGLTVPAETQNGARLRLRGLGMPQMRGGGVGDLIAEVDVRLPLPLTEETRRVAEQLRQSTPTVP